MDPVVKPRVVKEGKKSTKKKKEKPKEFSPGDLSVLRLALQARPRDRSQGDPSENLTDPVEDCVPDQSVDMTRTAAPVLLGGGYVGGTYVRVPQGGTDTLGEGTTADEGSSASAAAEGEPSPVLGERSLVSPTDGQGSEGLSVVRKEGEFVAPAPPSCEKTAVGLKDPAGEETVAPKPKRKKKSEQEGQSKKKAKSGAGSSTKTDEKTKITIQTGPSNVVNLTTERTEPASSQDVGDQIEEKTTRKGSQAAGITGADIFMQDDSVSTPLAGEQTTQGKSPMAASPPETKAKKTKEGTLEKKGEKKKLKKIETAVHSSISVNAEAPTETTPKVIGTISVTESSIPAVGSKNLVESGEMGDLAGKPADSAGEKPLKTVPNKSASKSGEGQKEKKSNVSEAKKKLEEAKITHKIIGGESPAIPLSSASTSPGPSVVENSPSEEGTEALPTLSMQKESHLDSSQNHSSLLAPSTLPLDVQTDKPLEEAEKGPDKPAQRSQPKKSRKKPLQTTQGPQQGQGPAAQEEEAAHVENKKKMTSVKKASPKRPNSKASKAEGGESNQLSEGTEKSEDAGDVAAQKSIMLEKTNKVGGGEEKSDETLKGDRVVDKSVEINDKMVKDVERMGDSDDNLADEKIGKTVEKIGKNVEEIGKNVGKMGKNQSGEKNSEEKKSDKKGNGKSPISSTASTYTGSPSSDMREVVMNSVEVISGPLEVLGLESKMVRYGPEASISEGEKMHVRERGSYEEHSEEMNVEGVNHKCGMTHEDSPKHDCCAPGLQLPIYSFQSFLQSEDAYLYFRHNSNIGEQLERPYQVSLKHFLRLHTDPALSFKNQPLTFPGWNTKETKLGGSNWRTVKDLLEKMAEGSGVGALLPPRRNLDLDVHASHSFVAEIPQLGLTFASTDVLLFKDSKQIRYIGGGSNSCEFLLGGIEIVPEMFLAPVSAEDLEEPVYCLNRKNFNKIFISTVILSLAAKKPIPIFATDLLHNLVVKAELLVTPRGSGVITYETITLGEMQRQIQTGLKARTAIKSAAFLKNLSGISNAKESSTQESQEERKMPL